MKCQQKDNRPIYCKEWWRHIEWWITNNDVEEAWWDMITSRILSASEIYQESTSQHKIKKKKCCSSFNEWNNIFYENVCYIYMYVLVLLTKRKKNCRIYEDYKQKDTKYYNIIRSVIYMYCIWMFIITLV